MKSKIALKILSLLGFSTAVASCVSAMYGTPNADYQVIIRTIVPQGERAKPVEGIKVSVESLQSGHNISASGLTDQNGEYVLRYNDFPIKDIEVAISIEDIDGEENLGHFAPDSITRKYSKYLGNSDGWYAGEASIRHVFILKEKESDNE